MADKPLPDDRAVLAALGRLKAYNAYKANQLQTAGGGANPAEQALNTIETWADDATDSGAAWGRKKQVDSAQKIQESEKWQEQVRKDDQQAAQEAEARSKLDMKQLKAELKKKLDDYKGAIKQQGDAGQPAFKAKLPEVTTQTAEAKKFVDQDLEKAMDLAAKKGAEQRQKRKLIAAQADKQAQDGKKWKAEYGDQPAKFGAGQRADVQAALDQINESAGQKIGELQPFAARAAALIESLKEVQSWSATLKPQVAAQGPALKAAKASGESGVANARSVLSHTEAFQAGLESRANTDAEIFRQWSDDNTRLAKEWIHSSSPKHKQWAEAWLRNQKE